MKPELTLLIHGPFAGNAYSEIFQEYARVPEEFIQKIKVLVVCYQNEREKTEEYLKKINCCPEILLCTVKDVFNPGFFNMNRQIVSVRRGLSEIPDNHFVIKLRNDQWVSFKLLLELLERIDYLQGRQQTILTTNCYTRKDRLYHPSDMFLCAWKPELKAYYNCPLQEMTHLDCQMSMIEAANSGRPLAEYFTCPEMILFRNYLQTKQWILRDTQEDSFKAIQTWCFVVNSWDIMLRWSKERPPAFRPGSLILPYPFEAAPFPGIETEHAEYYNRHDFYGEITKEDQKYLLEARGENKQQEQEKNLWSKVRVQVARHPALKRLLLKGPLGNLSRRLYVKSLK